MEEHPRYADSCGVKIAYQIHGAGRDLVMVPGFVSHLEVQWRDTNFRRFVRSLARVARVVLFDKRGTGLSDPVTAVPTLEERMQDLAAVVAASGCQQPYLLGFSEGGPIAIHYTVANPDAVAGLILYGTSPRRPPDWAMERLRRAVDRWGEGDSGVLFAPNLPPGTKPQRAAFERAAASPAMARALVESLQKVDVTPLLGKVHVASLVLHRRHEFIPLGEAEIMAAGIPGARLVVLEGEDHLPWVGDVGEVAAHIGRFIAEEGTVDGPVTPEGGAAVRRAPRPVSGWPSLSPAEHRVALLVAEGLTNAEVADRLFVSRYTVETHLKRIFPKLGIASRTELAAIVVRNT